MSDAPQALPPPAAGSEAGALAREMAAAFRGMVGFYVRHCNLTPAEAAGRALEPPPASREATLDGPADQLTFWGLAELAREDPDQAARRWEEVKREALDELRSGHRAAKAMEGFHPNAWQRAQFLALRQELGDGWGPRSGLERQLLDTLAQAQAAWLYWTGTLTTYSLMESASGKRLREEHGCLQPPRVDDAEAVERAAAMADRFNRIFLRTLRALRDLRRYAPAVVVKHAGQVNVGAQQVNVAPPPCDPPGGTRPG
jgi:hypothetical protein